MAERGRKRKVREAALDERIAYLESLLEEQNAPGKIQKLPQDLPQKTPISTQNDEISSERISQPLLAPPIAAKKYLDIDANVSQRAHWQSSMFEDDLVPECPQDTAASGIAPIFPPIPFTESSRPTEAMQRPIGVEYNRGEYSSMSLSNFTPSVDVHGSESTLASPPAVFDSQVCTDPEAKVSTLEGLQSTEVDLNQQTISEVQGGYPCPKPCPLC